MAALEHVDYFRLLIYMRPLQRTDPATGLRHFVPGTTIEGVLYLYEFDRKLRLLCMDAVERIEVALRAGIVSEVAVKHGAHFYLDPHHFTYAEASTRFQDGVREEEERNPAIRHYKARYSTPAMPPIWVAMEAVTFGTLSRFFSTLRRPLRIAVARKFGYDEGILRSWFRAINLVRNLAAHHGRLWNAPLHVDKPTPATAILREFNSVPNTFFDRAVVLVALLANVAPDSGWKTQLGNLFEAYPRVKVADIGFPPGWHKRPFWTGTLAPTRVPSAIRRIVPFRSRSGSTP